MNQTKILDLPPIKELETEMNKLQKNNWFVTSNHVIYTDKEGEIHFTQQFYRTAQTQKR